MGVRARLDRGFEYGHDVTIQSQVILIVIQLVDPFGVV